MERSKWLEKKSHGYPQGKHLSNGSLSSAIICPGSVSRATMLLYFPVLAVQ